MGSKSDQVYLYFSLDNGSVVRTEFSREAAEGCVGMWQSFIMGSRFVGDPLNDFCMVAGKGWCVLLPNIIGMSIVDIDPRQERMTDLQLKNLEKQSKSEPWEEENGG